MAFLGVAGLTGVYAEVAPGIGTIGTAGCLVAAAGRAPAFVAAVMQSLIVDVDTYLHTRLVGGGWFLTRVAVLISTAGLIFAGIDPGRTGALPQGRFAILTIGLLTVPVLFPVCDDELQQRASLETGRMAAVRCHPMRGGHASYQGSTASARIRKASQP